MRSALFLLLILASLSQAQPTDTAALPPATPLLFSIDVKESDIRDAVRMISSGYKLNVVIDQEIAGKVTLHLTDVPVMDGLRILAGSLGLSVVQEGSIYRICKSSGEQTMQIDFANGKLSADLRNADVRQFLSEISRKSGESIVPDQKVLGKISGKLFNVDLEDGLKALLEANGLSVARRKGILVVGAGDNGGTDNNGANNGQWGGYRPSSPRSFFIECRNDTVSLNVSSGDLDDVVKGIAAQTDLELVTYGELRGTMINAKLDGVPIDEAMRLLLGGTRFTFIRRGGIIMIGDRSVGTPSGQALSTAELVHLRHIKADDVPKLLPQGLLSNNLSVVKEQNALLVSGTSEDILKVRELLASIDVPTPQVVIDVLVVEYSRDLQRDFGIEMGHSGDATMKTTTSWPYMQANLNKTALDILKDKIGISESWFTALNSDFYMKLRLLEQESKAKILAQPSICVLNGNKASINVGQTQYFSIEGGTRDNPTREFRPISFGIELNITPWISQSGQITAELTPVISNPMGVNGDGYPNVFQRSVNTTVRLDNNQTLVLGGLLRGNEQDGQKKVPFLGDLPFIGALFRTSVKQNIQTNLVIYITPHVLPQNETVNLREELGKLEKGYADDSFAYDSFGRTLDRAQAAGNRQPEKKRSRIYRFFHRHDPEITVTTNPAPMQPASATTDTDVPVPADTSKGSAQ